MNIKEALLAKEVIEIKKLLKANDLEYDNDITKSFYMEDNERIIATVSLSNNIIKCIAIIDEYKNENLSNELITFIINYLYQHQIYHYMVYTKKNYKDVFLNLGFEEIISTNNVSILEGGNEDIYSQIKEMKKYVENSFNIDISKESIGALVVNCNPVTEGHIYLVEEALKHHSYLIVFLLEEDKSYFTYKERYSMLYLSLLPYKNVLILPSTKYIISDLTFPTYFLKEENQRNEEWAKCDALIFLKYFMKYLNIEKRYIGSETTNIMITYNTILKNVLGDKLVGIDRLDNISASKVRELIKMKKVDDALKFVPNGIKEIFKAIVNSKDE